MQVYNQPYFGRQSYGYNPYQQSMVQQPMIQQPQQQTYQPIQPMQPMQPIGLQGKSVDSVDVVKAMDIPLDGSVSYFPLTDGTAIITKQLQADGTSRTIIYKPSDTNSNIEAPKFVTFQELEDRMKKIDNNEEIQKLKKEIDNLSSELSKLLNEMKDNNNNNFNNNRKK